MTSLFARVAAAAMLLSGLSVLPLSAQESEVKGAVPSRADANDPNTEVYRLTDVLNKPVKDDDGAEVGRIKDLVVNGQSREVLYAVVALNDGKEKDVVYVMPWTAFRPYYGQNAFQYSVLTLPQSVWIQAPYYSMAQWGTIPFAQWGPRVNNYYSTHITQKNNSKSQNVRVNKPSLDDGTDKPRSSKSDAPKKDSDKPADKNPPKAKDDGDKEPQKPNVKPEPKAPAVPAPKPGVAPKAPVPKTTEPTVPKTVPNTPPGPREPKTNLPNPN